MISCGFVKHPQCYWSLLPLLYCLPRPSLTKALPLFSLYHLYLDISLGMSPTSMVVFYFPGFYCWGSRSSSPNSVGCHSCLCLLPRSPVVEDNTHIGDRIWPGWESSRGFPPQCWKVVCKSPKEKSSQKSYPTVMCKAYDPQWHHGLNMAAQPVRQQWQH